jgi:hypothetical protein
MKGHYNPVSRQDKISVVFRFRQVVLASTSALDATITIFDVWF